MPDEMEWRRFFAQMIDAVKSTLPDAGFVIDDDESITVGTTVVSLSSKVRGHNYALITVETAGIRFWLSSTLPTATVGHTLEAGDSLELFGPELSTVRFIRRDAADATIRVSYGKRQNNA